MTIEPQPLLEERQKRKGDELPGISNFFKWGNGLITKKQREGGKEGKEMQGTNQRKTVYEQRQWGKEKSYLFLQERDGMEKGNESLRL